MILVFVLVYPYSEPQCMSIPPSSEAQPTPANTLSEHFARRAQAELAFSAQKVEKHEKSKNTKNAKNTKSTITITIILSAFLRYFSFSRFRVFPRFRVFRVFAFFRKHRHPIADGRCHAKEAQFRAIDVEGSGCITLTQIESVA